jgi:hypothetical protein
MPQSEIDRIKVAEKKVEDSIAAFEEEIKRSDGFARQARAAFIRFKTANDNKAKVNRAQGKRSFSPTAMEREDDPFDTIWTYTYWAPFVVYVEKPKGRDSISPEFKETLESKAALLKHLVDYFKANFIDKYGLKRVKPEHVAAQAEEEGWPLQIVVFKDGKTFNQFVSDTSGQPIAGARALYSPLDERVLTYDDTDDKSSDTTWFNESVLIHETFHMLSDHYAQDPRFTRESLLASPRYSSILVQEGLTDFVAGFSRGGGEGHSATYEFMQVNHLRLRDMKFFHQRFTKNQFLYRIQDMVDCRHYGQCIGKGIDRWRELKLAMPANPRAVGSFAFLQSNCLGQYYATAALAAYFFHYYEEGGAHPYRAKWWDFVGKDYKDEIKMDSQVTQIGVEAFKQTFGISTDADWDAIQKKFEKFTETLTAQDVGKSGGPEIPDGEGEGEGGAEEGGDNGTVRPLFGNNRDGHPGRREILRRKAG